MIQTVNFSTFQLAFESIRPNNFTYEGLTVLFDYLQQYESDTGEPLELDVIALCCDYSEMTPKEISDSYGLELSDDGNELLNLADDLHDLTIVAGVTDTTIIFANF